MSLCCYRVCSGTEAVLRWSQVRQKITHKGIREQGGLGVEGERGRGHECLEPMAARLLLILSMPWYDTSRLSARGMSCVPAHHRHVCQHATGRSCVLTATRVSNGPCCDADSAAAGDGAGGAGDVHELVPRAATAIRVSRATQHAGAAERRYSPPGRALEGRAASWSSTLALSACWRLCDSPRE